MNKIELLIDKYTKVLDIISSKEKSNQAKKQCKTILTEVLTDLNLLNKKNIGLKTEIPLPLERITREGETKICNNCGSTVSRNGFLSLFGELLCINKKCPNSISKIFYH